MTEMDLLLAVASHARHRADQLAIVYGPEQRTYRQLANRISLLAGAFEARNCQPGDRIGIAAYGSILPCELYLAAQAAQLQPVMLSWTLGAAIPNVARTLGVQQLFAGPEALGLPGITEAVARDCLWDVSEAEDVAGGFVPRAATRSTEWMSRRRPAEAISGLQFSAGSTGLPKAVLRTVRADVWDGWHKSLAFHARDGDVWLCITPRNLGVLAGALRPMLLVGGTVQFLAEFSADATLDAIRKSVTILPLQTPHWRALLEHPDADRLGGGSVRTLVATGQRTPVGLADEVSRAFAGARFVVNYGTTESSTVAILPATDAMFGTPSCVGSPLPTIRVEVVNRAGERVQGGERGEIRLQGPSVVPGYDAALGSPSQAVRDGWFHTGDVGAWDDSGNLYVIDRWADVFETQSGPVFPGEIQEELFRLPSVREVAVAGVDGPDGSRVPTAFVVCDGANVVTEVRRAIQAISPVSFTIQQVNGLPKTLGGKLDRVALRKGTW